MKLNRTGSNWTELERNKINENWDIIEGSYNDVVGQITDEVVGHLIDSAKLIWKEPVDTVEGLPASAEVGETRMVREADPDGISYVYRYDGENWEKIQAIDVTLVNEVDRRLSAQLADITYGLGTENLIPNGDFSRGDKYWLLLDADIKSDNGLNYVSVTNEKEIRWKSDNVEGISQYIFSLDAKRNDPSLVYLEVEFEFYDANDNLIDTLNETIPITSAIWRKYSINLTTLNNTDYIEAYVTKQETTGNPIDVTKFILNFGNVAIDFKLSKTDEKDVIDNIEKNIPTYGIDAQFLYTAGINGLENVAGAMLPLEHRVHTGYAGLRPTEEFYIVGAGHVIAKTTDGVNFNDIYNLNDIHGGNHNIVRQFTLKDGRHICFNEDSPGSREGDILLFSSDYSTKKVGSRFDGLPYDIHGIDQGVVGTATVCFSVYNMDDDATSSVYRASATSINTDVNFEKVFTVNAAGSSNPEIRHFHVCAADPRVSGRWYLFSGDHPDLCHMWVSEDDGITWSKKINGDKRIRTTHINFGRYDDYIYWSEDNVGGGFYRMNKYSFEIETLVPFGVMEGSCYNCTATPHGWVVHTHRNPNTPDAYNYIYLIDEYYNVHTLMRTMSSLNGFKSRLSSPSTGNFYSVTSNLSTDYNNIYAPSRILRGRVISMNNHS